MLSLEPFPRSTALRHFLGIAMPPPADLSDGHVAGHWRLGAEMRRSAYGRGGPARFGRRWSVEEEVFGVDGLVWRPKVRGMA